MRQRITWAGAVLTIAVVLVVITQLQPHPGAFATKWYWENDSVGNYVADLTVVALGVRKLIKEWRAHRAHQTWLEKSVSALHEKHDRLHVHLGVPQPEET